jgi:hypothetical protein
MLNALRKERGIPFRNIYAKSAGNTSNADIGIKDWTSPRF